VDQTHFSFDLWFARPHREIGERRLAHEHELVHNGYSGAFLSQSASGFAITHLHVDPAVETMLGKCRLDMTARDGFSFDRCGVGPRT
jgi:hypothetical protein